MRRLGAFLSVLLSLAAAAAVGAFDGPGQAAPPATPPAAPPDTGQPADAGVAGVAGAYAFRTHCASCHGVDAKGEGPLAENLHFRPPDLTLIARRNGGSFPTERVYRIVDGRSPLKGHGGPDMPVWGDAFKNADTGYDEAAVKAKLHSVVEYLRTIQAR
jgi:mono/diheme cytochrome c family protein